MIRSMSNRAGNKWEIMLKWEQPVRRWALRLHIGTESKTLVKADEGLAEHRAEVADKWESLG